MDYENVYYVENRNATPVVVDHRTGASGGIPVRIPPRVSAVTSSAGPASWAPTSAPYQYPYPNQGYYGPGVMANWTGYPVQPPYVVPPVAPPSNLASILGGFGDIGSLANIIAQAFAAFLPLPAAPTPQDATESGSGSDPATNAAVNSSNLIRYQSALALFARRDQQILTLGSVLKELFKRPGVVAG
jgi:hypothetical protein